jgi:DNA-directed RNA polymerase specialized sigma24 family protein
MTKQDWKEKTTRVIIDAINRLPQSERDAFVCKHYKGMAAEEIATHLQRTMKETESILSNAERRVSKNLNRMNNSIHHAHWAFC